MKKRGVAFQRSVYVSVCLYTCVFVCMCNEAIQPMLQSCFVLIAIICALTIISL